MLRPSNASYNRSSRGARPPFAWGCALVDASSTSIACTASAGAVAPPEASPSSAISALRSSKIDLSASLPIAASSASLIAGGARSRWAASPSARRHSLHSKDKASSGDVPVQQSPPPFRPTYGRDRPSRFKARGGGAARRNPIRHNGHTECAVHVSAASDKRHNRRPCFMLGVANNVKFPPWNVLRSLSRTENKPRILRRGYISAPLRLRVSALRVKPAPAPARLLCWDRLTPTRSSTCRTPCPGSCRTFSASSSRPRPRQRPCACREPTGRAHP